MIDATVARLVERVPAFQGRVTKAASLARLMSGDAPPVLTPAAWVLPSGITGGVPQLATGAFRQGLTRLVSVVLMLRVHDRTGERALDEMQELIDAVILALSGWTPPGLHDQLFLRQGRLTAFAGGEALFELTFAVSDQLRIVP